MFHSWPPTPLRCTGLKYLQMKISEGVVKKLTTTFVLSINSICRCICRNFLLLQIDCPSVLILFNLRQLLKKKQIDWFGKKERKRKSQKWPVCGGGSEWRIKKLGLMLTPTHYAQKYWVFDALNVLGLEEKYIHIYCRSLIIFFHYLQLCLEEKEEEEIGRTAEIG